MQISKKKLTLPNIDLYQKIQNNANKKIETLNPYTINKKIKEKLFYKEDEEENYS